MFLVEKINKLKVNSPVIALAMLPIAFDSDNAGREIMGPMANIIIGVMASSTILNLLIMPIVMLKFGKFKTAQISS